MKRLSVKTRFLDVVRKIFTLEPLERALCRHTIGKFVQSPVAKMVPSHLAYPKGTIRRVRRGALNFEVDLSDYNDWKIFWGLREVERELLFSLAKDKKVILDIGTNVGFVLLNLAKICGKSGGRVIGFEPDPLNYERCMKNIALNDLPNVEVNNSGCGSENRDFRMHVPNASNRGRNTILQKSDENQEGFRVSVVKLDEFLPSKDIRGVDLVKIDVEGFEMEVLKGAESVIQQDKPEMFIELDDRNLRRQNSSAADLISFIENLGYDVHKAVDNSKVTSAASFQNAHYDIHCIAKK